MTQPTTDFLKEIKERGFLYQCTDLEGLTELMAKEPVTAYIGFDCTAPSLHVGSLIQIMMLRWLQNTGHNPIVLIGGITTKVGDPSGKDEMRQMLSDKEIDKNIAGIKNVFKQFGIKATFVNNADWLSKLNAIDMLREYGRHFSVNRMMTMDSVKGRLERESPLSFIEFNYMVLQAIDFVHLAKEKNCRLQIGGSDQWGNIVSGIELWRRIDAPSYSINPKNISLEEELKTKMEEGGKIESWKEQHGLFGLTTPLITTSTGAKMGKTAAGAVWLNAEMCSPYDYWQFWRNTSDADVGRFLRLFTDLPIEEIKKLEALKDADINKAKIVLANEATRICHGEEEARKAAETAQKTFAAGSGGSSYGESLPVFEIEKARLQKGIPAFELLFEVKLAESKTAARKLIQGKGGRINDIPFTEESQPVTLKDANKDGIIKLSSGKKNHALVKMI